MASNRVTIQIEQQIALVQLSRPEKHNALDMAMFYQITDAITQLKRDQSIRVVIVSGKGESFSSGLDVKSVMTNRNNAIKLLWKWWPTKPNLAQKVTIGWRQLKVPVIMVLHGKCWGGGMQIALGGDFRIASADCSLSIMEAKWGLIPDMGGTSALMENITLDHAMKMAMTAEVVTAQQALDCNLITEVSEQPFKGPWNLRSSLKRVRRILTKKLNQSIKKSGMVSRGGSSLRKPLTSGKLFLGRISVLQ